MKNPAVQVLATMIGGFIIVVIALVYLRGSSAFAFFSGGNNKQESVEATAIRATKIQYKSSKEANTDFSQSPCLSQDLGNGYSLDVVHDPRTVEDETNQCSNPNNKLVEILPDGTIRNIIN